MAWLSSLFSSWLVNPLLFAGGALLVSVPIIIYLWNRRRFQVVDWAAMDFLLEAERQNRRRVQLENLILLLLRCLLVLLLALLVSRPLLPQVTGNWLDATRYERLVILDDSPSMGARWGEGPETSFSQAIQRLEELVEDLAGGASDDALTVVLTSAPNRPLLLDVPINDDTVAEIVQTLKQLVPADRSPRFEAAVARVEVAFEEPADRVNRVLYVMTDLRAHDWEGQERSESAVVQALSTMGDKLAGCFVVDVGGAATDNLGIVSIAPQDKALVVGLPVRYEVVVRNYGESPARRVPLQFAVGQGIPLRAELDWIPPGGTAALPFTYTVAETPGSEDAPEPLRVEVAIDPSGPQSIDLFEADNQRFFAARVTRGIDTLIVDGDAAAELGQSESFYLQRALAPPGDVPSGMAVHTITDVEFETEDLDRYQTIFLCNVFRLSEQRRESLEAWVVGGGGLIVMPGNQVDDRHYAVDWFQDGNGILPLELLSIDGDEDQDTWVSFAVTAEDHPVFAIFEGGASPVLETAKVFHWWKAAPSAEAVRDGRVNVLARFTDNAQSPAIVEMAKGEGRVVMTTFPADTAWSNWPEEAGYLVTLQELTRYLARQTAQDGGLVVGETIRQPVDLSQVSSEVTVQDPTGKTRSIQPVTDEGTQATPLVAVYSQTENRGFYEMTLNRVDGQMENRLFAANLNHNEGSLTRADQSQVKKELGEQVRLVAATRLQALDPTGARTELWKWVLAGIVIVMCGEQLLAWGFAARR